MLQTNSLFQTAIENYTTEQIARRLGLHSNTVARWKEKNNLVAKSLCKEKIQPQIFKRFYYKKS